MAPLVISREPISSLIFQSLCCVKEKKGVVPLLLKSFHVPAQCAECAYHSIVYITKKIIQ